MSQSSSSDSVRLHQSTDDQTGRLRIAAELRQQRRDAVDAILPDVEDDSDEEPIDNDDLAAAAEEREEKENIAPPTTWSRQLTNVVCPPLSVPSGPQLPVHHALTELDFFQCMLTQHTVQTIAINSTAYAHSKGMSSAWETTADEVWLFIAVNICMGISPLPRAPMYWEARWQQPFIANAFSRNRFMELLRFFHIAPPTPAGTRHTVIDKIAPLITASQHSFSASFLPAQVLVVDESMVAFTGRDPMKQYIPAKPTPWGYKVWCVASDKFLLNFEVYRGASRRKKDNGVYRQVVSDLVQPYSHRGHLVFLDNLFVTVGLFDHLERTGFRACGTLRPQRSALPADLITASKSLRKGARIGWQRGNLSCLAWMDKRLVYFLTNHVNVDITVSFDQQRSDGSTVTITKPKVVHEYNLHRGGVDTLDQLRSNYSMGRKSMKNWPSLAWWLLDMCVINAYRLFTLQTGRTASQLEFRIALMDQLAAAHPPQRAGEQQPPPRRPGRPSAPHYPKRSSRRRDCSYCSEGRKHRQFTFFVCDHCDKHLCVDPCFRLYHEAQ